MDKSNETYYTILNVDKNCSAQDIKRSFIELSKKYHPDKNSDSRCHQIFVKVNEAYSVLNKPSLRHAYDESLRDGSRVYHNYYDNIYTTRDDPAFWKQKSSGGFGNEPYYGIKGLKKVSNSTIVALCLALAAIGLSLQTWAIRSSFTFDRERMRHESARNQILWEYSKSQAMSNGNSQQITNFEGNLLKQPTVRQANAEYIRRLQQEAAENDKNTSSK